MIKDELKNIDTSDSAVKKTGLSVGVVLIIIAFLLWWADKTSFLYFSITGSLLIILVFIAIPVLRPFHRLWMLLAVVMGFVMSRIIITILYYLVITPIGLIAKIAGKKFMPLGFDKNSVTYWEKRSTSAKQQIDYDRQF